jgi:hypothetical protein
MNQEQSLNVKESFQKGCICMGNNEIPKDLPKCELIRSLAEKISQREDIDFHVFGRLDEFRQKVSGEVRQINELFPEYTPHDEQYHLKRLFYVADTVLGKDRIKAMNAGELFILAIGLYGHDWGMAVNEIEKNYIINNVIPKNKSLENLWILPDETNRFKLFARDQLLLDKDDKLKDIPIEKWREYVRLTHAFRSGVRIRKFFEPIDGGVADAAARVCEGHWLNFENLQDDDSYPINYSVMRDEVNLRALAIYLRLIDLLDLAEDRTPYVIWKFVAPRDSRSKMAWDKHRALRAITCPKYQKGRIIRVDGSTDSHEVYAALEDLRIWCEMQFRGCNDLLARMNDSRHKLDIYHIDWHVEARGFRKTSIGFQFDRERMFEILGNELYQGDPYVFLRELLQNSIDAIRMRREILRKNAKIEPANFGAIHVDVDHLDNNDAIITWSDDGIGMDEYIVQNYLAVAGKSYYHSSDIDKLGLVLDPISRFGIGILSCFMVANNVEITTYKDPNLYPRTNPLKITIPDKTKQFRIEILPEGSLEIGTTIKVFVEGKRISEIDKSNPNDPLDVTKYLSIIAGFVEFPIIINERNSKTIILHPKEDSSMIKSRFNGAYKIHQIGLNFPWSEIIYPQDLDNAKKFLKEFCFNIDTDLELEDYEGSISYLVPIDDNIELLNGKILNRFEGGEFSDERIVFREYETNKLGLSMSSMYDRKFKVFKDGILVPAASEPEFDSRWLVSNFRMLVNISKENYQINVARTDFTYRENWYDPISKAYSKKIENLYLENLLSLNPAERLFRMGWIKAYHLSSSSLFRNFPLDYWPVAFLKANGKIAVVSFGEIKGKQINLFPDDTYGIIEKGELHNILYSYFYKIKYVDYLDKWSGEPILLENDYYTFRSSMKVRGYTPAVESAIRISGIPISKLYCFGPISFVSPPWNANPPLIQCVLVPTPKRQTNIDVVIEHAVLDPKSLNYSDLDLIKRHRGDYYELFRYFEFSEPFSHHFGFGEKLINIKHPVGERLFRLHCYTYLHPEQSRLKHSINYFYERCYSSSSNELPDLNKILQNLWAIAKGLSQFEHKDFDGIELGSHDFIPGSLITKKSVVENDFKPFGFPL